jgi:hypothetical protein
MQPILHSSASLGADSFWPDGPDLTSASQHRVSLAVAKTTRLSRWLCQEARIQLVSIYLRESMCKASFLTEVVSLFITTLGLSASD